MAHRKGVRPACPPPGCQHLARRGQALPRHQRQCKAREDQASSVRATARQRSVRRRRRRSGGQGAVHRSRTRCRRTIQMNTGAPTRAVTMPTSNSLGRATAARDVRQDQQPRAPKRRCRQQPAVIDAQQQPADMRHNQAYETDGPADRGGCPAQQDRPKRRVTRASATFSPSPAATSSPRANRFNLRAEAWPARTRRHDRRHQPDPVEGRAADAAHLPGPHAPPRCPRAEAPPPASATKTRPRWPPPPAPASAVSRPLRPIEPTP